MNYSILRGHTDLIKTLTVVDNETIASGSCDNTIKLWNITSLKNIATLTDHTDCINSLIIMEINQFNENEYPLLVSASKDNKLRFWKKTQKRNKGTLKKKRKIYSARIKQRM